MNLTDTEDVSNYYCDTVDTDLGALLIAYRFAPRLTCSLLPQPRCWVSYNVMRKYESKLLISAGLLKDV